MTNTFKFNGTVAELDPDLHNLLQREDQRQQNTIILIPSESLAHEGVQEAMGSTFGNVYAEGYPMATTRRKTQADLLDIEGELARYRRYGDDRYYKGVEYANILESLARRRAAELFSANGVPPEKIYVNVQPLSGGPANTYVYTALLQPGDTIMGLDLNHGGHLSHGSKVNRSGQLYKSTPFKVDPDTELLDYDTIEQQALEVKPNIIVAGFTAYPFIVDWKRFRAIADKVGAYLLADISHISGLVAAGVHPSPIGIADIVMTTTHKSLCGPRGAMHLTHRRDISRAIDRAVFPGEQGGPHLNNIAALAFALKMAKTDKFRALQQRIVDNATRLAAKLQEHGLRVVSDGTENHLLLIDCKSVKHKGVHLSGDMAARVLDLAGIVTNRNTIPGDRSALSSTGVRIGTVWISQLGYGEAEIDLLAEAMATILLGCKPFEYIPAGRRRELRTKVDYQAFVKGRAIVRQLTGENVATPAGTTIHLTSSDTTTFLNYALTSDVLALGDGDSQTTHIIGEAGEADGVLHRLDDRNYHLHLADSQTAQTMADWFQMLSEGFVQFDDLHGKLPGPLVISVIEAESVTAEGSPYCDDKPFFIGASSRPGSDPLPRFTWEEPEDAPLKRTSLYETHKEMGAKMVPFGGWDMPVWYSSVSEEHHAVRNTAGLFDVSHMGVFEADGEHVVEFLNTVLANDVSELRIGRSHYTYLMQEDGSVVDDLLVYRRATDRFLLVVNASNNDKDWAWLNAVNKGEVMINETRPGSRIQHPVTLRDLRDPRWGDECRVDIALQGPKSRDILLALTDDATLERKLKRMTWAGLTQGNLAGLDVIISRTGYTGERVAYELFVHPDKAPEFWQALVEAGEPFGLKPCGLASRDSTRTEAGLPLYGHELASPMGLNPADAGFGSYVKLWKPFFIGRSAFIAHEQDRQHKLVRFRMNDKAVRRPEQGDPILDRRGKIIGTVTSCAIDQEGYLLGQAMVPFDFAKRNTQLSIYQLGGGKRSLRLPKAVKLGAKMPTPDGATVLSRFPVRKK